MIAISFHELRLGGEGGIDSRNLMSTPLSRRGEGGPTLLRVSLLILFLPLICLSPVIKSLLEGITAGLSSSKEGSNLAS